MTHRGRSAIRVGGPETERREGDRGDYWGSVSALLTGEGRVRSVVRVAALLLSKLRAVVAGELYSCQSKPQIWE